jgi:hypothetical protein
VKKDPPYRELLDLELKAIQLLAEKNKLPIPQEKELLGTHFLGVYTYQRKDHATVLFKIAANTCELLDAQHKFVAELPIV